MQRIFITSSRSLTRVSICRIPSNALRIPRLPTANAHSPLYSRSFAYSLHARNARSSQNPTTPPPPSEDDQLTLLPPSDSSKPSGVIKVDEPRKSISFNCGVEDCGVRQTHEFTKRSYERGIVIIQCPGCKNRHLIADHLGWFKDATGGGRTIEDFMKEKGVTVKRGHIDPDGTVTEYAPE